MPAGMTRVRHSMISRGIAHLNKSEKRIKFLSKIDNKKPRYLIPSLPCRFVQVLDYAPEFAGFIFQYLDEVKDFRV